MKQEDKSKSSSFVKEKHDPFIFEGSKLPKELQNKNVQEKKPKEIHEHFF
jgi:hypothetical protein